MTSEAIAILQAFRNKRLGPGSFIAFWDFGDAIVWEAGSVKDDETRKGLQFLMEEGYVNEMNAGLELTEKGAQFLKSG
jgi:hypothetical protein